MGYVEGDLCHYHSKAMQPVTLDAPAGLLARWCGTHPTTWEERPERCREALQEVDADAAD